MPRYPRNYIKTNFFHVMSQGIDKSYIFKCPEDAEYYIFLMNKLKGEININIIAYCVMSNHVHILIRTRDVKNLSKFMQRLNTSYGTYFNKKNNRVGFVFRNRFKSEGIYNEKHLYNCIDYIYNNPVKAGMCAKPEQYPFSNYRKIDGLSDGHGSFIDTDEDKALICKNVVTEFISKTKVDLFHLREDKQKIKELLIVLRNKYDISFDKIAIELGLSKSILWRIWQKQ